MLPSSPSFARIALNRTTFGARDTDVVQVERDGWAGWVEAQLNPPAGDDPSLASHMAAQRMLYQYPAMTFGGRTWDAVDELRPFIYLDVNVEKLWRLARGVVEGYTFGEQIWPHTEQCAALFIRNTHSRFQLREFMTDFWLNHFSMSSQNTLVGNPLVAFERDVVRPNVFGNFRQLIEEVTKSTAMLMYLNNADSSAALPNENYARELMELHTMGEGAYLGKSPQPGAADRGFTDFDVLQAARALSGWTVEMGQIPFKGSTGNFTYHAAQHNAQAGVCLGFDLSSLSGDMTQGRKVLDLVAAHPATAHFICTKICRRMFGDTPPAGVVARAEQAFALYRNAPDQIARVLRAILLDGAEIGTGPAAKVRRPYERLVALWRTTDTVVGASPYWAMILGDVNDSPFVWPTPNGRPDVNNFWLNTFVNLTMWQYLQGIFSQLGLTTSLLAQTPIEAQSSQLATVEYWISRLIGYGLAPDAFNALVEFVGREAYVLPGGEWKPTEDLLRRLVIAISTAPEFVLR